MISLLNVFVNEISDVGSERPRSNIRSVEIGVILCLPVT